jgi:uncharacterized membrane protein YuzA (DUF378 family)
MREVKSMANKKEFKLVGYDYVEKIVGKQSKTASVIYLPARLTGKRVAIIQLEE